MALCARSRLSFMAGLSVVAEPQLGHSPLPPPGLLWRALLDHAFDAILVTTRDGKVALASQSFYELAGYEPDEVLGQSAFALGLLDQEVHRAVLTQLAETGRSGVHATPLRTRSGEARETELSAQLVGDYLLTIMRDCTERRRAERATHRLMAIADAALGHVALGDLLDALVGRVRDLLEVDTAAILLVDEDRGELVARAARGLEEEVERGVRVPLGQGFAGRVAAERRIIALEDVEHADVINPLLREKHIKSLLGAPLLADDRVIGVVHAGSLTPRHFSKEDRRLLLLAAERAALGVEKALLHEELLFRGR